MLKKFFIFVFIFLLGLPVFASIEDFKKDKILKSEIGKVEKITYEDIEQNFSEKTPVQQIVTVKLLTGEFKGRTTVIDNILTGNPYYDIFLKKGDKVILHAELDGDIVDYFISDIYRINFIHILFFIFSVLLIVVGRKKGLASLFSIIATILLILFVLAPLIRQGFCPILTALVILET